MDFQERLNELIKEAEVNGYLFKDGCFEKVVRDNFVDCLNIHFISAGDGESAGRYQIFSKSYLLLNKDVELFLTIVKEINKTRQFENIFEIIGRHKEIVEDFMKFIPSDFFSNYSDNWVYLNEDMKTDEADDYFSINSKYLSGSLEISMSHIPQTVFNELHTVNVKKSFYWKFV